MQGVARIFGRGSATWSEATDSATFFASQAARSAADRATAVVRGPFVGLGAKPPAGVEDFMMILNYESTCKWHVNKN